MGRSTTEELVTLLGQPHAIERWGLASVYVYRVYWEGSNTFCDHRVTISGDVIQAIEECTLLYPQRVLLPELVLRYGRPDLVEWSRTGPGERVVVFSHAGVLADVVGLPFNEAYVITILYVQPRSPLRIMIENWTWLSPVDPFPGSDIVGSKDPWFGTSKDCRAICSHE